MNTDPRPATLADIDELIRLRGFLLDTGAGHYVSPDPAAGRVWRDSYRNWLHTHLETSEQIYVGTIGSPQRLSACAIAVIDNRAPTHAYPNGKVGWVQTVVVDPVRRGEGLGKAVVHHVLDWLSGAGVRESVLQTTPSGTGLYYRLGFQPSGEDLLFKQLGGSTGLTGPQPL
ncbi:GNAT family N-acetyltransferase [Streptomyces sp. CT34]|uniref:GNAT family N-acetyltransferase n=1 Tax=Streptomyces sp. CT34 TaxID=1553907 RepID=UPI000690B3DB|nr:GNAT family N-acetyltransferase [Streptomyces sp. CT34]